MIVVCHVVDAMGGGDAMWGKERVIYELMHAQLDSGCVAPSLAVFSPTLLSEKLASEGFRVYVLHEVHQTIPCSALIRLYHLLTSTPRMFMHTHCYKANIVGRLIRRLGVRNPLVSTCHAWHDDDARLTCYNRLDRASASMSDITVICDPGMMRYLRCNKNVRFIANAMPDRPPITVKERSSARVKFGFGQDDIIVGALTRLTALKGARNLVAAADNLRAAAGNPQAKVLWAVAGAGPLEDEIRARQGSDFRFLGYVSPATEFLAAIDMFVQPSALEGMSMSLLEAMRAGLPIVATRAGGTEAAVRDGVEAIVVDVNDPPALANGVRRLALDSVLASRLAARARMRFEAAFRIDVQHKAYLAAYNEVLARRCPASARV